MSRGGIGKKNQSRKWFKTKQIAIKNQIWKQIQKIKLLEMKLKIKFN
jgi:hypothetical protein